MSVLGQRSLDVRQELSRIQSELNHDAFADAFQFIRSYLDDIEQSARETELYRKRHDDLAEVVRSTKRALRSILDS